MNYSNKNIRNYVIATAFCLNLAGCATTSRTYEDNLKDPQKKEQINENNKKNDLAEKILHWTNFIILFTPIP